MAERMVMSSKMSAREFRQFLIEVDDEWLNRGFQGLDQKSMTDLFSRVDFIDVSKFLERLQPSSFLHLLRGSEESTLIYILSVASGEFATSLLKYVLAQGVHKIYEGLGENSKVAIARCVSKSGNGELLNRFYKFDRHMGHYSAKATETQELGRYEEIERLSELSKQLERVQKERYEERAIFSDEQQKNLNEIFQLKEKVKGLTEEHQKHLQKKIDDKLPKFVSEAITLLREKEVQFSNKALRWNLQGNISMLMAISLSIWALFYGAGLLRDEALKGSVDWLFFGFLLFKGLIIIGLLAAWARHAFNIANAYVHESLKRSDRTHAINFGKLYIDVYGNDVTQVEMRSVFENWNLDSDSAFVKIKPSVLEPKVIGQYAQLLESLSRAASGKNDKSEK